MKQAIGLPKNKDVSLDRIDPAGHYEIGNLRWTNKHVQAANKKVSASTYAIDAIISQQHKAAEVEKYRRELIKIWNTGIRAHNRRGLTTKEKDFLDGKLFAAGFLEKAFEWGSIRDGLLPRRVFCLPSLTCPGKRIKICGGPWDGGWYPRGSEAAENGVISGLGSLEVSLNAAPQEIETWHRVSNSSSLQGIIWVGNTSTESLMHYPIEGRMLAMASRLFRMHNKSGAMYPVLTVFDLMEEASPNWLSELEHHPLLNVAHLFIPDVQVNMGIGWSPDPLQAMQLLKLLQYRRKYGLKTFLGVQDIAKLPLQLAVYLSRPDYFEHLHVGMYACPEHPEPNSFPPYPVPQEENPYE